MDPGFDHREGVLQLSFTPNFVEYLHHIPYSAHDNTHSSMISINDFLLNKDGIYDGKGGGLIIILVETIS